MKNNELNVHIGVGTIITTVLVLLGVALLFYLKDLVLVVLTAVVIASSVEPAILWMKKYRIPRVISVIIVYLLIFLLLFSLFYAFVPPLLDEAAGFISSLPGLLEAIELPIDEGIFSAQEAVRSFSLQEAIFELRSIFTGTSEGVLNTIAAVFGGIFSFVFLIMFSFYLSVQDGGIESFLRVITPIKHEPYVIDLWKRSQRKIGLWMPGQIILSVLVVVLVYLGLTILQVPYALLLAIIAGVFEIIPVFGSILAAVPAITVGLIEGGVSLGLLVTGLFVIVNQFQGNLIYPLVVKKVVGVSPLLVILAIIIGAQLAGFLGVLLSVPIAATLQEFVSDIEKRKRKSLESQ